MEKNEKYHWLHGESNPGLLTCLAEALPLDQGVNWILAEKNCRNTGDPRIS